MKVYHEITPLEKNDLFIILDSVNKGFEYPIHNHAEFELNLVLGSNGTRIVGDSTDRYNGTDLVMLGPYLYHKWDSNQLSSQEQPCRVITLQFGMDLFDTTILSKEPFQRIKNFLQQSNRGIQFYGETLIKAKKRLIRLTKCKGFDGVIEFLKLMDFLSKSFEKRFLASEGFKMNPIKSDSKRVQLAYQFILSHFKDPNLKIRDVAFLVNMSESSFSHYFKKNTNRSYTRFLIDIRIGYACKLLINTDQSVGEIGFDSGFNNITNFNRLFKKYRGCTPLEYRAHYRQKADFNWSDQITPFQFMPSGAKISKAIQPKSYSTKLIHS